MRALTIAAWGAAVSMLAAGWALPAHFYAMLPPTIPTHFNAAGDADGLGAKAMIWLLPVIATPILGAVAWGASTSNPNRYNLPFRIAAGYWPRVLHATRLLLAALGATTMAILLAIEVATIGVAMHQDAVSTMRAVWYILADPVRFLGQL